MFKLEFSSQAKKFLKKRDNQTIKRILDKIKILLDNPFPTDAKRVQDNKNKLFRVRVGDYRIVYYVEHLTNIIFIARIDIRERVYD